MGSRFCGGTQRYCGVETGNNLGGTLWYGVAAVEIYAAILSDGTSALMIGRMRIAAEGAADLVTVTHFTSTEGALAIGEGGTLNAGSFVTTSDLSGLSASEVESALEIGPGKGAFSTTFQTPA